jgi:outer membrane protease
MLKAGLSGAFLLALAGNAFGGDLTTRLGYATENDRYFLSAGIGYSWIKADEIVYEQGHKSSHLFWASEAPIVSAEMRLNPYRNFTLRGRAKMGLKGKSTLDNYDWMGRYWRSSDFDDWTHHSHHDSIDLERYLSADFSGGYDFHVSDIHTINLHGGFKYTNIQWSEYGGTFVYSNTGFRADKGTHRYGKKGITYEQRFPAWFVGPVWSADYGRLSLSALGRLGATVAARDIDYHWLRSRSFAQKYEPARFMEISATARYRLADQVQIFAAAGFEKHSEMRGDTYLSNLETGRQRVYKDAGGATLQSITVSAGLKLLF